MQAVLDARWLYEQSLATHKQILDQDGTCGLCVSPTTFSSQTSGGDLVGDCGRIPNWREELKCACRLQLNARQRAVLHFLTATIGLGSRTKLLLFGPPERLTEALADRVGHLTMIPRLDRATQPSLYRIPEGEASQHLVVSVEYLNKVPPLDQALQEIARILAPGGLLVFTVPFRTDAPLSKSFVGRLPRLDGLLPAELAGEVHEIGWDILDQLRATGFSEVASHLYWSEELGYLGPYNIIFSARK